MFPFGEYVVPLRISFTGCATDNPVKIGYHTGMSVCATIDKYVRVKIMGKTLSPSVIEPECDLIQPLLDALPFRADIPQMQIEWESDIALGNGLGGSSALLVAVAKHFFHHPHYQAEFVATVEQATNHGWQDSAACAYQGCRVFKFRHNGFLLSETLPLPDASQFMLVSTNQQHDTKKLLSSLELHTTDYMNANAQRCKSFILGLRRKSPEMMGMVLNEVHLVKSERPTYLIDGVNDFLDEAKMSGAYGGCMLGSGGGGHVLLAVDSDRVEELQLIISQYGYTHVPFNFV